MAALPISIFIEGLVKEFFPELMKETPAVIDAADKMIAHLAAAPDVDPTLLGRAQNAIQGIKQKSPTSALKKLAAADWFEESLIGRWRKVRNSSAPPTRLKPLQPSSSAATLGAENETGKAQQG